MPIFCLSLASDHRGFALKARLANWLKEKGHAAQDLGPEHADRCDATDFAQKLAKKLAVEPEMLGVLICGSGHAMTMTANRYRHIRAALCLNTTMARSAREHNDANVLVLPADIVGSVLAEECLEVFLEAAFLGGRYAERRDKLTALGGL